VRNPRLWVALAGIGLMLPAGSTSGQPPAVQLRFRSAIDLTSVTATVLDRDGRLVKELPRGAFEVFEDGEPQAVTQFTIDRVPISVTVLVDVSDSMFGRRLHEAVDAVEAFVGTMLDPADEFSIVTFNHRSHVLTSWSDDRTIVPRLFKGIHPWGATAVYDALVSILPDFETRHRQRAAALIISDGADTASDVSLREVRSMLLRSDAFVYAVAIDSPDPQPINTRVNPSALREVTDQSGGRTEVVHGDGDLAAALSKIADELNSQYLLGYSPARAPDGQYHSIRVRVPGTDYRVRARNGYVATPRHASQED
jgi:VWFA-related protein